MNCKATVLWPDASRRQPGLWRSSWLQIPIVREEALEGVIELVQRVTGKGFAEYVGQARVQWARRLLAGSGKRISEVAYECGFESVPHFNRQFKRMTGVTPSAFRAEYSKKA